MIHKADVAYLALGDYRNGACSWRTGQFVLITEPEVAAALEAEGAMDLLQRLDQEAFLGPAGSPGSEVGESGSSGAGTGVLGDVAEDTATDAAGAQSSSAGPGSAADADAATELDPTRQAEGITAAGGKQRGRNRMRTGGQGR